jgi:hypothetical protein
MNIILDGPKQLVLIFAVFLVMFMVVKIRYTGWVIGSGYDAHLRSAPRLGTEIFSAVNLGTFY